MLCNVDLFCAGDTELYISIYAREMRTLAYPGYLHDKAESFSTDTYLTSIYVPTNFQLHWLKRGQNQPFVDATTIIFSALHVCGYQL